MKNYPLRLFLVILVAITACKKESSDSPVVNYPPASYIKTVTLTNNAGSLWVRFVHYYDAQNRLTGMSEVQCTNPPDTIRANYTLDYSPARVILKRTLASDSLFCDKMTYLLNAAGLAASSSHVICYDLADSTILSNDTYQYNTDGYLLEQVTSTPGGGQGTVSYEYSGMNVASMTTGPGSANNKFLFYYDPSHINTIGNTNTGLQFLGKSFYNAVIRVMQQSTGQDLSVCTYEYDQYNRIVRLTGGEATIYTGLSWISVPFMGSNTQLTYTYY